MSHQLEVGTTLSIDIPHTSGMTRRGKILGYSSDRETVLVRWVEHPSLGDEQIPARWL